jgi:hypothetical protein
MSFQYMETAPDTESFEPVFVECGQESILIQPWRTEVSSVRLKTGESSAFHKLIDEIKAEDGKKHLIFLIRPEGIATFHACYYVALERKLSTDLIDKDALLSGGTLVLTKAGKIIEDGTNAVLTPIKDDLPALSNAKKVRPLRLNPNRSTKGSKTIVFECHNDRVFPVDLEKILDEPFQFLLAAYEPGADRQLLVEHYNARAFADPYYRFEFKTKSGSEIPDVRDEPCLVCHPKAESVGESMAEAQLPGSAFRNALKDLDKGKTVIRLRVRSNSFAFFRDLRDLLRGEGYQVGWFPEDGPLQFFHPKFYGGTIGIDL